MHLVKQLDVSKVFLNYCMHFVCLCCNTCLIKFHNNSVDILHVVHVKLIEARTGPLSVANNNSRTWLMDGQDLST